MQGLGSDQAWRALLHIPKRRPRRAIDDCLDFLFSFGELRLTMALQRRAALISGDRSFQGTLAAFQFPHKSLEFRERLLEGKGGYI